MRKIAITTLVMVILKFGATAQEISYDDFRSVIPLLEAEDFKGAFNSTNKLLEAAKTDSSDLHALVTYINLYFAAGMVSLRQMTYEAFEKHAQPFIGRRILMSGHPCVDSAGLAFNSIKFITMDGVPVASTITSNQNKTNILAFEYFKLEEQPDVSQLIGKNLRCGGILEKVEVNPNHSLVWICRLYIGQAFFREI